jgi:hypothetical protein
MARALLQRPQHPRQSAIALFSLLFLPLLALVDDDDVKSREGWAGE